MEEIKHILIKAWQPILIFILIVLLFNKCDSTTPETKYINKTITVHKNTVKTLYDTITIKEKQIVKVRVEVDRKINEITQYNNDSITNYYRERYNTVNEIKSVGYGVVLTDSIAKVNIKELVKYDGVVKELSLTNEILDNTKLIVSNQDSIIDLTEGLNKSLGKELRKEKRQKTGLKIIAVGAFVGGVIVGGLVK